MVSGHAHPRPLEG
jgi:hypothetical protein